MTDIRAHDNASGLASFLRQSQWHRIPWVRRVGLPLLHAISTIDVRIRHQWVPELKIRLNVFRHKTYWYHGRRREHQVMRTFAQLIKPGDTVIELGGHIGYTSLYLARLVGPAGKLFVFEPQRSNLRYLQRNVAPLSQIEVVPKAASDHQGTADFFVDGRTGENSTLVPGEFEAVFAANRKKAFSSEQYFVTKVETVALDDFIIARGIRPDFVKIDIEGAELLALRGMQKCLGAFKPKLMVEVTCEVESVAELLEGIGYKAYTPRLEPWAESSYGGRNRFYLTEEVAPASRGLSDIG